MTEGIFQSPVDEARWLESSILKSRLLSIAVAMLLFMALPWPYGRWIQGSIILLWLAQGLIAAYFVRRAVSVAQIRWSGRILLALDALVLGVVVYLYMPLLPDVWIAMLVIIMWAGVRERLAGATAFAAFSSVLLVISYVYHGPEASPEPLPSRLFFDLSMIWLSVLAIRLLVRGVSLRSEALVIQHVELERAAALESEMRARSDKHAATIKKVTELAVSLLRERELDALLDRMLDVTLQNFGFGAGAILVAEREHEAYVYRVLRGYPPETEAILRKRQVPFALAELKLDKRFAVRPSVFYAPTERHTWYTDPEICHRPDLVNQRRTEPGAWHEADCLMFALVSSSGEFIGMLVPDAPIDGRIPSHETIDNIALFAKLAAAAVENVHIVASEKSRANTLSEQNVEIRRLYANVEALAEERRLQADRLARILELTAAIFRERDLKTMLRRILKVAVDTFGFAAGTILLRDPVTRQYVRHAAVGYPTEVEGVVMSEEDVRADMTPVTRVRDTFYYVPMELHHEGGVTRHPDRLTLPRIQPGDWHENDLLLFPIFDSAGSLIGVLSPDDPKNRRVPSDETIRTIEVFAQLAGMAVESARLRAISDVPA